MLEFERRVQFTVCAYAWIISGLLASLEYSATQEIKVESTGDSEKVQGKVNLKASAYDRYVSLFEHQRAIQLDAVKSLQKSPMKYDQKYRLTESMVKDIFKVLDQAKNNLTEFGFVPGDPFPETEVIRDAMSNVFENTAIFGDLILRLPDITHNIYDKNKQWEFLIGWAVWFSMEAGIFQGPHEKLLSLMSMELGLQPKDETFVNPYDEMELLKEAEEAESKEEEKRKKDKNKLKKKSHNQKPKRKGPKLSSGPHSEL